MNEGAFLISIKDAAKVLKKMNFLKGQNLNNIGIYSKASLSVAHDNDLNLIYQTAIDNYDYELLLDDDSIFQLSKKDEKYRYAFIQSQSVYFSFMDFLYEIFNDDEFPTDEEIEEMKILLAEEYEQRKSEQKINSGAMYIRYDVDSWGYKPNIHSYAHFHIGLNNNIRLPSSLILTPISFVLFIVKHVYTHLWEEAINKNIINEHVFQFKRLCEEIPSSFWHLNETRDLFFK